MSDDLLRLAQEAYERVDRCGLWHELPQTTRDILVEIVTAAIEIELDRTARCDECGVELETTLCSACTPKGKGKAKTQFQLRGSSWSRLPV